MGTFLVIGIVSGVIYGLTALGLVLVYKGSRVFNFAQAEFAAISMYTIYYLTEVRHLPYGIALIAALLAGVVMALLTERLVVRPLKNAPRSIALVGTAGVALLAIGLELVVFKPEPRAVGPAISGNGPQIFGYIVSNQKLLSLVALIVIAVSAALFFKKTYLGTAILANSQDAFATRIIGASTNRISVITWGLAGLLGAIAGALIAPDVTFFPSFMTATILIPAFTAGIVGGMTSLGGALVGGQIIGIVEGLGQYMLVQNPGLSRAIPEGTTALVFVVLLVMLLIRPKGIFGSEA
ncbi:MAG: branched-chain amino acid ABC transporter permease [Actinomycetota bacterium]